MELLVNGETENELDEPKASQTLEEYLEDLNEDLEKVNKVAQPETVNGDTFSPEFSDWTPERIDRLEISVKPIEEVVVDSLVELADYLDRARQNIPDILDAWDEKDEEEIEEHRAQLDEAFSVINQVLTSIMGIVDIDERLKSVKQINSDIKQLHGNLRESTPEQLNSVIERTDEVFTELRDEAEKIVNVLAHQQQVILEDVPDVRELIVTYVDRIPELVQSLQTEEKPELYDEIADLTDDLSAVLKFVEKLDSTGKIKLLLKPEDQEQISHAHQELDQGLTELDQAFEDKDVIMVCDILEYEIKPYLERIGEFLEEITDTSNED